MDALRKVWEFIKKYWQLLAGLFVGLLLFLFSISRRSGVDKTVQQKEEEKAKKDIEEAGKVRDLEIEKAREEHDTILRDTIAEEVRREPGLTADPKATNDFLIGVGKGIKGE